MIEILKDIEKNIAWSVIGVFLAIIFGLLNLYQLFYLDQPEITFEIINETNVLDINKSLDDLKIYFQGENIRENDLALKIITLKVDNVGTKDILQNHYDNNDNWGFKINSGEIVEARLINANSEYLKQNVNPKIINENSVKFNKVILEKNKYFLIETLVLYQKNDSIQILPEGKIAGIDKINIRETWKNDSKESLFYITLNGDIWVQLMRLVIYSMIFIILLVLVIIISQKINDFKKHKQKKDREEKFQNFKKINDNLSNDTIEILHNIYVNFGKEVLYYMYQDLSDEKSIKKIVANYNKLLKYKDEESFDKRKLKSKYTYDFTTHIFHNLIDKNIININNKEINIDDNFMKSMKSLINYLGIEKDSADFV